MLKSISSTFNEELKIFHLKVQDSNDEVISVKCTIALNGVSNDVHRSVDTTKLSSDYVFCKSINPYLSAQSDVFKIKIKNGTATKTVGYVFPASALEGDEEDVEENFDEAKQAYKFYAIKSLTELHKWNENQIGQNYGVSVLTKQECSYIILFMPLLADSGCELLDVLPHLALYGYYHFPDNAKPNVLNLINFSNNREELDEVIKGRFLYLRNQAAITLKNSKNILNQSPLIKLLYQQLLVEADNPLYRFLILYQVIEYLVDKYFREGLDKLISEKGKYSNYKFLQEIHELNNTRSTINKLFDSAQFDEKQEIMVILKGFISELDAEYDKEATGDCVYDIRNLLLHDYKRVLAANRSDAIVGLVIHYEILIHRLVIELSNNMDEGSV